MSELFIIYLAAAAPFGVSRFLSEKACGARTRPALLKGALAALAWPYASLKRLRARVASARHGEGETGDGRAPDPQQVERAKRAAVGALRAVEDLLEDTRGRGDGGARHALFAARECVERYAGLALAASQASPEARPTAREMELCRIAGRGGDDLLVAGRCVHRRNVTRLVAHRERASAELLQALAAVCELARRAGVPEEELRAQGARRISEAVSAALARAAELPACFDDRETAAGVERMSEAGQGRADRADRAEGEEPCTTQAVPTAFATSPLRTTASHGG